MSLWNKDKAHYSKSAVHEAQQPHHQAPTIASTSRATVPHPKRRYNLAKVQQKTAILEKNLQQRQENTPAASGYTDHVQQPNQQAPAVAVTPISTTNDVLWRAPDPENSSVHFAYAIDSSNRKRKSRAPFECIVCLQDFKTNIPHGTNQCEHQICRNCVRKHFETELEKGSYSSYELVQCPSYGCTEYFVTDEALLHFMTKVEVKRWWNKALEKSYITNKVKCPMPGCHAVFDVDQECMKKCTFAECYECRRGFCIACQKPWHPGEIRMVDDTQAMEMTLVTAKDKNWTRCPNCNEWIEKVSGCTTIRCRCKCIFCYRCGSKSDDHFCLNQCQSFDKKRLESVRSEMFAQTTNKKP